MRNFVSTYTTINLMKRLNPNWVHSWLNFNYLIISLNPHKMQSLRYVSMRIQARDSQHNLSCRLDGVVMEKEQKPLRMFSCGEEVRVAFIST